MNKKFFVIPLSLTILSMFAVCDNTLAAPRSSVRSTQSARKNVATTTASLKKVEEVVAEETPKIIVEEPVILNKASQFDVAVSETIESSGSINSFAEQITRQRAALAAAEATSDVKTSQQDALKNNSNKCDSDLRKCMIAKCGNDFTKCALDGDSIFGDKLNACKRETQCEASEFTSFSQEIKADRDMNVRLSSYNNVINCGNRYNACIMDECGTTYNKCLGKAYADAAIQKCADIAKECKESDSGLASRFGNAIGLLRGNAEKEVKQDEERLYALRDLMKSACNNIGAMFDERTFDCIYTVNFFAGENQESPTASRKRYAGDTFVCMQEWFGVNTTTFMENAYRETRAQTAASSAMLGSGVGTAAGLISSGAIGRAVETQKAKKELKNECKDQPGKVWKNGKCVDDKKSKETENETPTENDPLSANATPPSAKDSGNYTYFKPPAKNTGDQDCAIETNVLQRELGVQGRVYPEQCKKIYDRSICHFGLPNCDHISETEKGAGMTVQKCKQCTELMGKARQCIKEAEDWCKKNNYL